jgi:hypothetical protein
VLHGPLPAQVVNKQSTGIMVVFIPNNPLEKTLIPAQWVNIKILSALRSVFYCWIPACAGMTA